MEDLLVAVVRPRPRSPECSVVSRHPGMAAVFRCRARNGDYGIEWERYGTGRYEITRPPGGRVVARGTLSISE